MAGAGAHHLFMAGAETGLRVVIGVSLSVGPGRTHGECSVPVYRQNLVYLFNPYLPPVRPSTPQAWSGGRTQGRPYSANNRMSPVVCPSRRSRVRAARKPVSPLGNYFLPTFLPPRRLPRCVDCGVSGRSVATPGAAPSRRRSVKVSRPPSTLSNMSLRLRSHRSGSHPKNL